MQRSAKRRPSIIAIAALIAITTLFAVLVAEGFLRLFVSPKPALGQLSYATADGQPVDFLQGLERRQIVPVPPPLPMNRDRFMFAANQSFFLCYTDNDRLRRDWLDAQGRVEVHINSAGIREREDLAKAKPQGQRRIVCLGDSFTFGWGIPEELGWVRLLENELRKSGSDVRTVNCGAAGTVCVDEYWFGLKHRFHTFQPDAVVLTICLNDLIPSSGLQLLGPSPNTGSRVLDLVAGVFGRSPLDLDPKLDWVDELLRLPKAEGLAGGLYHVSDKPFEAMWAQGVPQQSLRAAKAWCDAQSIPFLVVLWPFLQGLAPGAYYPFQKIHDLVAADCAAANIAFLDVLPALRGTPDEQLWVTPADPHANPRAHALVMPSLLKFVQANVRW